MEQSLYNAYLEILKEELVPAMGCTEPIAVAYAAALAARALGCPAEKAGTLEDLLFHDRVKNKTYVVRRPRGGVKQARLHYEILAERDGLSLARIRLETGRTHQIRVQFASRGLPLLGDGKYGSRDNRCACALWSYRLSFPDGKNEAVFEAQPPSRFPWTLFF